MPQLDFSFYLSQFCWLIISFGAFFFVSKFFLLPKLNSIFSRREDLINDNLNRAKKILAEVEKISKEYNDILEKDAKENQERIDLFSKEMHEKSDRELENFKKSLSLEKNKYIANIREQVYNFTTNTEDIAVTIGDFLKQFFDCEFKENEIKRMLDSKMRASKFNI